MEKSSTLKSIPINKIKPYPSNAKKHTDKQIQQIANSIKEFGFNQPIVVDKDNVIIAGHGRFEAAKLLGFEEIPIMVALLSEEQAKAYRLADNKLNESDWDMQLVIEELSALKIEKFDITLTGFSEDDLTIFSPLAENENDRLDLKKTITCPECGYEF